jgi:hypothetical protein
VAGPYVKHGAVVHNFYNQTSVLRTMETMFRLPPMNQMDAAAPLMRDCFNETANLQPYNARPNTIPIPETRQALNTLRGQSPFWEALSRKVRFDRPDASDDDALNRILWHEARGEHTAYPARLAGPHGKGLHALGLKAAHAGNEPADIEKPGDNEKADIEKSRANEKHGDNEKADIEKSRANEKHENNEKEKLR